MLQATAVVRRNSVAFVRQLFALYAARRPLVLVSGPAQAAELPGITVDRCIDPGEGGGWIEESHPVILDDQPAQVSYTSGTEGLPKGILLTYLNLGYTTERIIAEMRLTSEVREYVGVPATFSFGMARFRAVSAVGGKAYLPPRGFDPLELARMLGSGEVNALSAVPTLLRILLADPKLIGAAGTALRWLEIGSQAMTVDEKRQVRAMFPNARIVQHYGLTEASRSTFLTISEADEAALASVGRPSGQGEVGLSDDGRIRLRGPHVARFRIDAQGLQALTDADGWLQTNDLGQMVDGNLVFGGRADDLINCGGQKIVPDQLEEKIRQRLRDGTVLAVAKVPDDQRGEGVLVAAEGTAPDLARLRDAAAAALQDMGISAGAALHVMALDALPVTGTGKVQRRVLAEQFALRKITAPPQSARQDVKITDVLSLFRHEFPGQDVSANDTFETLGGDSLHYIQFSLSFEAQFGHLPDGWEKLRVSELEAVAGNAADTAPKWRRLEMATLTRAFFMICIIALHTDAFIYSPNWGAAYFLVMLAGYSVARFQLPEILRSESTRTLWGTIRYVAIPTILMDMLLELVTLRFEWPSLFLVSNYVDPENIKGFTFYFVEFYVQILIIVALLFMIPQMRDAFRKRPLVSAILFFGAVVVVNHGIESVWDGEYNYHRTPWHYGWCFALGMVVALASNTAERIMVLMIAAVTAYATWHFTSAGYYFAVGSAALIFVRSVPVPALAKIIVAEIAGASMFMYLTHYEVISLVEKVLGEPWPWLTLGLSILVGVGAAHFYAWLERKVSNLLRERRSELTAADAATARAVP